MNRLHFSWLAVAVSLGITSADSKAAALASDAADGAIYTGGWSDGQNGGSGFAPWQLLAGSNAGFFVFTSQGNGANDGNIDTSGNSWGLYANSGSASTATRAFTAGGSNGSNILGAGEQFLISLDNGFIQNGGSVGFGLQNSLGSNELQFVFNGGTANYSIVIGATTLDSGIPFTSKGLALDFTQGAGNSWSLAVTPNGGATSVFTDASAGSAPLQTADISQVRIFNSNAGGGGASDAFANSVRVIPEPGVPVTILGAVGVLALVRRRNR